MDLVAAFDPTRLAIWRPTGDSAQIEWQVEPNDWGPTEARWRGADTVVFTRNRIGATPDTIHREPWHVARAPSGAWTLKAP